MAQIVLSQAGAVAGRALLPQGLSLLGQTIGGAAIGRTIGSLAGQAIDAALTPPVEGPRISSFSVMESREGAGLPAVYGRARVGGQVVWASRFLEKRNQRSSGKGGPKINEYAYSVSVAIALCQGPITRMDRIWANGEELPLAEYNWRLYKGHENQTADPLIEAIEGTGGAPAYRGTAYIVFEDLPLDRFGNRLPQFSFEVIRAGGGANSDFRDILGGVNIIPATGEFVYGTQIVRERRFPGIERAINMNNGEGRADFSVSLDQLDADLPNAKSAALTVAWFGSDLRAGACKIRPGVETHDRDTVPYGWQVDGLGRGSGYLISRDDEGNLHYGGTPADESVLEGIAAMKALGIAVTLSPFLLMDVPPGNGLPDPYLGAEQAPFPWRGRIVSTSDGSAQARADIDAFVGSDGGFGYRHFILHHARLAQQAGGVSAFLIGSEMVGMTRIRDENGAFPFVEALVALASEVRAILGPSAKISYAADWSEYGTYQPGDGSGDVLFPLDALWASDDIDFVGIDWYPPTGDWRNTSDHLDLLAGYKSGDAPDYLLANIAGGEAFDWYYTSQAERDAQIRTPIVDTSHGEDWIFRAKDLPNWWNSLHYERPGGIRNAAPTAWQAGSKPIRLIEIGFPAVDKGANSPNLFYDPKSAESAFPPYSDGVRDDLGQRRALFSALSYWSGLPFIEDILVWAWDGRPWPYFPGREDIWSDGPNWQFGHWLNGRVGLIEVSAVINDIAKRAGIVIDAHEVDGFVEGYVLPGVSDVRTALAPLQAAFGLNCVEQSNALSMRPDVSGSALSVSASNTVLASQLQTRPGLEHPPSRVLMSYVSGAGDYAPALAEARSNAPDAHGDLQISLPLVLGADRAEALATQFLEKSAKRASLEFAIGPDGLFLEPADQVIAGDGAAYLVERIEDKGLVRTVEAKRAVATVSSFRALEGLAVGPAATVSALPEFEFIEACFPELSDTASAFSAVSALPWRRPLNIEIGPDVSELKLRGVAPVPAGIGRLVNSCGAGPLGRWDTTNVLDVEMPGEDLSSVSSDGVLNGANRLVLQGVQGAEILGYQSVELVAPDRWLLKGLLRGLNGSPIQAYDADTVVIVADERLVALQMGESEMGREQVWRAGEAEPRSVTYQNAAALAWRVGHLRVQTIDQMEFLTWTARGKPMSDSWTYPEATNTGFFQVEWLSGEQVMMTETVSQPMVTVQDGYGSARVSAIGADGRAGRWVSIILNAD